MIPGDRSYYKGTDVLANKHDLRDPELARAVEYKFAYARELELRVSPIEGKFDFAHLKAIHHHIFQDTYEWAGEVREVNFSKRNKDTGLVNRFAPKTEIARKAAEFDRFIEENGQLKGLPKEQFIKLFTEAHTRLNEIHPFREGNGRATRIFLEQLAREAGHELRIDKIDKNEWNLASHTGIRQHDPKNVDIYLPGTPTMMRKVLTDASRPTVEHAFVHEPRDAALKQYPGLASYFERLDSIASKARQIAAPEDAEKLIEGARSKLADKLRSDRIGQERSEAMDRLAEVRPGARDSESVYGPRNNYEIVADAMREVFVKRGFSESEVAESISKAARHFEAVKKAQERTQGYER